MVWTQEAQHRSSKWRHWCFGDLEPPRTSFAHHSDNPNGLVLLLVQQLVPSQGPPMLRLQQMVSIVVEVNSRLHDHHAS
jgi:hypothetical protein